MARQRSAKERLDRLLVSRGLFPTRAKAQAALMAGKVRVLGVASPKAGLELPVDADIEVLPEASPFVSRGGLKLAAALDHFGVDPGGRVALDVGASTGGFTDCLLQRGTRRVYAVDVGYGQFDESLKKDPRVSLLEKFHAKELRPGLFDPAPDLAVADVSFISLTKILAPLVSCLAAPAELLLLIKPQFELEPKKTPKGIVRDERHRREAVEKVLEAARKLGLREEGVMSSPVTGAKGNVEFFSYLRLAAAPAV